MGGPWVIQVTGDPCEARGVFPLLEFVGRLGMGVFACIRLRVAVDGRGEKWMCHILEGPGQPVGRARPCW